MKEMTLHQKRFNGELGIWLKKNLTRTTNVYQIMLKANDIWAESNGHYPEKDEVWIADLCYELLKVIEDLAWLQFDPECKEAQDLLCFMSISELTAPKVSNC